jgi:spermidine synthase
MNLWFTEEHTKNVRFSIRLESHLCSKKSKYQKIDIFESKEFGRIMTLDGYIMVTEKDEFIYHDMIVHVPMASNKNIKNVLLIGAGDGGAVRELTRYKSLEHVDLVEIDEEVVKVSKEYLPTLTTGFSDPRITCHFEDGLKFVRRCKDKYDLIIVDSTDPFGPGEGLFTREFYGNCFNALTDDGILVNQHESPYYFNDAKAMIRMHNNIKKIFPVSKLYQAHIPSYPSGHWLFGFASKGIDPLEFDADYWNGLGIETKYYNTDLHRGCFALPNYVIKML